MEKEPDAMMKGQAWTEFKTTILPWLLAVGMITLFLGEEHHISTMLLSSNTQLVKALEAHGSALSGITKLLSEQGYVVPPTDGSLMPKSEGLGSLSTLPAKPGGSSTKPPSGR